MRLALSQKAKLWSPWVPANMPRRTMLSMRALYRPNLFLRQKRTTIYLWNACTFLQKCLWQRTWLWKTLMWEILPLRSMPPLRSRPKPCALLPLRPQQNWKVNWKAKDYMHWAYPSMSKSLRTIFTLWNTPVHQNLPHWWLYALW